MKILDILFWFDKVILFKDGRIALVKNNFVEIIEKFTEKNILKAYQELTCYE